MNIRKTFCFYKLSIGSLIILFYLFYSCSSCSNSNNQAPPSKRGSIPSVLKPYNITILLDLSDRDLSNNIPIPTTDIPIKHDTTAIRIILSDLKESFRSLTIKDKVNIECAHIDNSNYNDYLSNNYKNFKIDMEEIYQDLNKQHKPALSIPIRKKEYQKRSDILIKSVTELENIARKNPTPTGGDITQFLNEKLKYYYIQNFENILIILTDGNEVFIRDTQKNRKEIELTGNYPDLKILMLGINTPESSKNTKEVEQIHQYWINKYQSLKITPDNIEFNDVNDINLIEKKVKLFIKS